VLRGKQRTKSRLAGIRRWRKGEEGGKDPLLEGTEREELVEGANTGRKHPAGEKKKKYCYAGRGMISDLRRQASRQSNGKKCGTESLFAEGGDWGSVSPKRGFSAVAQFLEVSWPEGGCERRRGDCKTSSAAEGTFPGATSHRHHNTGNPQPYVPREQ